MNLAQPIIINNTSKSFRTFIDSMAGIGNETSVTVDSLFDNMICAIIDTGYYKGQKLNDDMIKKLEIYAQKNDCRQTPVSGYPHIERAISDISSYPELEEINEQIPSGEIDTMDSSESSDASEFIDDDYEVK